MKTSIIIVLLCLIPLFNFIQAQNIGVNTTGAIPDASSILDISSTDKGVLIPRVNIIDLATAAPITAPINSLLVYNTNITSGIGFYFWNGTEWINLTDNSGNADEDWYEVGTTTDPDNITDNIYSMGNVSIGVNTTTNNLEVSSGNDPTTIRITETSGTDVNWELRAYNVALGGPNNQFSIWGGLDGSTQTDRFVIAETGEVGIGTTSPTNTLHVSGGIGSGIVKIEADTDNTIESDQAYILMEQDGGTVQAHLGFGSTEATGDIFRIALRGGIIPSIDYNTFTINAQNKRVGINTSNANKPLSVFGTGVPANMTGGGPWATFSDSTLKKNITAYNEGLSLIMKIKPHSFSYNRKYENIFGGGKSLNNHVYQGIIAQELIQIAPDMVEEVSVPITENNKTINKKFLQVNTNKFTYALINATKEQQAFIEEQAAKIIELEKRLKAIEKSLKK